MTAQVSVAPAELELVRSFVNTRDLDEGTDAVATPAGLAVWLLEQGLVEPGLRASNADVARVLRLREALRALLLANNGAELDAHAAAALNEAADRSRLVIRFDVRGNARVDSEAGGVDAALGRLVAIAHRAMIDGSWIRMKACRLDDCEWAFYDRSKNQSRSWCSMSVCGNRAKSRAYRRRHGS